MKSFAILFTCTYKYNSAIILFSGISAEAFAKTIGVMLDKLVIVVNIASNFFILIKSFS
ncbi:hypothetical protein [Spiroplasma endosymbiont of Tipula paludosa]|uniref:hypothetical protein n=1 Tax=Spiroplasma endosymbiont of Tipula paludosa TaxID=3066295 RepID=UPI0035C8E800